jgi:uncharacterized protein YprB with RNaseH-like and TPR domain
LKAPVARLSKQDIVWLSNHRCKHSCTYLEHYNCYQNEIKNTEKMGFLDIETSNLKADFGIMLSYCIKEENSDNMLFDVITKKDMENGLDKRIVQGCINDMGKFDRVATYYGTGFDIPFIRTRALILKLNFPEYGALFHTDVYYMAKRLLCLSSKRQNVVAEAITGVDIKTRIEPKYWIPALQGDKKALDYILDHNKRDARQLESNYHALKVFATKNKKSI